MAKAIGIIFAVNLQIVKLYVIFQTGNSKSHAFLLSQRVSALSLNHFYSIYYVSVLLSSLATVLLLNIFVLDTQHVVMHTYYLLACLGLVD